MTKTNLLASCVLTLMLVAVAGCAATSHQQTMVGATSDTDITANVNAAVDDLATLDASSMEVATANGVVHLSGFVSSHAQVVAATDAARNVAGVTSVRNDMMVKTIR